MLLLLWKGSFRLRLTVGLAGAILLIMSLGSAVMLYSQSQFIRQSAVDRGKVFSQAFAMMGAAAVIDNLFLIQEAMLHHLNDPDVIEVDVVDEENMIVAAKNTDRIGIVLDNPVWLAMREQHAEVVTYEEDFHGTSMLVIVEPLWEDGKVRAWIRMVFSIVKVQQEMRSAMMRLGLVTVVLMLAGMLAVQVSFQQLSKVLKDILHRLQSSLAALNWGRPEHSQPPALEDSPPGRLPGQGEFEQVTTLVSETTQLLQQQSETIQDVMNSLELKVKERTAELEIARDQALESTRAKSTFLATMSHEIRTPLNGVMGMTELMLASRLSIQQQAYAEAIRRSGSSLLTIINDILDFSKIEAGKIKLEEVNFDLKSAVSRIVELLMPQAEEKEIALSLLVHPTVPLFVRGDPTRLGQILTNLISNAIKFTLQGEVVVEVRMSEESRVRFSVRDTGIGISQNAKDKIFQSFSQTDSSTTRKYGGTGLGLAISKRFVEVMGGEIGVISELGKGSTFWLTVRLPEACGEEVVPVSPAPGSIRVVDDVSLLTKTIRVLVVEDNEVNREVAMGMLHFLGYSPDGARTGWEALEQLKNGSYDLVLMDCQMPDMDGFEATREIRRREEARGQGSGVGDQEKNEIPGDSFLEPSPSPLVPSRLPIIAMTANVMQGEREKCLEGGMDDYLSKPFSIPELERILRKWGPAMIKEGKAPVDLRVLDALQAFGEKNDSGFFGRIVEGFIEETQGRLARLRRAVDENDYATIAQIAHNVKSGSGCLGANGLSQLCARLEHLGRRGETERLREIVADIEVEYHQVCLTLKSKLG